MSRAAQFGHAQSAQPTRTSDGRPMSRRSWALPPPRGRSSFSSLMGWRCHPACATPSRATAGAGTRSWWTRPTAISADQAPPSEHRGGCAHLRSEPAPRAVQHYRVCTRLRANGRETGVAPVPRHPECRAAGEPVAGAASRRQQARADRGRAQCHPKGPLPIRAMTRLKSKRAPPACKYHAADRLCVRLYYFGRFVPAVFLLAPPSPKRLSQG